MNQLKATGFRTILEEKRLSTDCVVDRYPDIWRTVHYHDFNYLQSLDAHMSHLGLENLIKAMQSYFLREKKGWYIDPFDVVEVWGREVKCSETDINDELNCTKRTRHSLADKIKTNT